MPCCHLATDQVSDYWRMVIEINDYQKNRFVERVIKSMFNTVSKKKIAVGGQCGADTHARQACQHTVAAALSGPSGDPWACVFT